MFDFVHENKRVVQIVLLLLVLPFAFWGVSSYRQSGGGPALATVEGEKITQQDFDNAMRRQQEQMQQMMRGKLDPAMFDNPVVRHAILDNLISQKLLAVKAHAAGLTLSDEQLFQLIAGVEAFQTDGKFDRKKYVAALRGENMTPATFEARVKEDIAVRQLAEVYSQNGYASNTAADNLIRAREQQRVASVAQISPDAFQARTKVDDEMVKKYYDANQIEFAIPERARVEYVVLSADALASQMTAGADEVKKYYDEHKAEFTVTPEQRHAAHILIAAGAQASEAEKKVAREKAESILKEVKQSPEKFAELARKYSADPGSAANGGDLGFFAQGMMVKPFEDAAFGLRPGEISAVVQSEFGFHIIKLLEVKAGKAKSFDEVKSDIARKLKLQKGSEKFAELADKFSNLVYEQSDSLKPAAELAKVAVQQSAWLNKGQPGPAPWTDKALQAVFSDDVLKNKRNSPAVEVAPDTLVSVHLLEHKPAETRPLAEVSALIKAKLTRRQAAELAAKEGQSVLAGLQRGDKLNLKWGKPETVSGTQPPAGMDPELERRILQADVSKLPAYVGAESAQGGYLLARVEAVKEAGPIDDAKRARYARQLSQATGQELLQAYVADARKRASISAKAFTQGKD